MRQERITALVEEQGFVRVTDLSARFGVSTVTVRTDLELGHRWEDLRVQPILREDLQDLVARYELRALERRVAELVGTEAPARPSEVAAAPRIDSNTGRTAVA